MIMRFLNQKSEALLSASFLLVQKFNPNKVRCDAYLKSGTHAYKSIYHINFLKGDYGSTLQIVT